MAELVFSALACEVPDRRRVRAQEDARIAVLGAVEGFRDPPPRRSDDAPGRIGHARRRRLRQVMARSLA